MSTKNKYFYISIAILVGVAINCLLNTLVEQVFKIPLIFGDTVGTIAVAFSCGGIPGLICAVLSQIALGITNSYFSPIAYFYVLAVWGAVGVVWGFKKPLEKSKTVYSKIVILVLISILMAFVVSILGGIINTINTIYSVHHNLSPDASVQTQSMQADMVRMGFTQLPANILGRLPGNMIERPVTTFLAYGISLLTKLILKEKN